MVLEEIRIGVSLGVFGIVLFCFLGVFNFFLNWCYFCAAFEMNIFLKMCISKIHLESFDI